MDRLTVGQAAERLGISGNAVYKRIERDQIRHDRDDDGRVYVYVDPSATKQVNSTASQSDNLMRNLEDQVRYLRDQLQQANDANRENRRIIADLTSRIPEPPPPQEHSTPPDG